MAELIVATWSSPCYTVWSLLKFRLILVAATATGLLLAIKVANLIASSKHYAAVSDTLLTKPLSSASYGEKNLAV